MRNDHYTHDEEFVSDFVFAPLLGTFMILWARIERAVDVCLANHKGLSSSHLYSKKAHGGLSERLKVLRELLAHSDRFQKNVQWISATLDRIEDMSATRNALIHGYLFKIDTGEPPTAHFNKKRHPKEGLGGRGQVLSITPKMLHDWTNDLRSLDADLAILVLAVATARKT